MLKTFINLNITSLILFSFLIFSCNNKKQSTIDKDFQISDFSFIQKTTFLRSKPTHLAKNTHQLKQFDIIKILQKGKEDKINNQKDFWYQVKTKKNETGWVFGADTNLKEAGQKTQLFEFVNYDLGDLEYLFFKNSIKEEELDFGQGYNSLSGYNFQYVNTRYQEYTGNPEYIGKKFKITYNYLLSDKLCLVPESYEDKCIIPTPTIIKIKLID